MGLGRASKAEDCYVVPICELRAKELSGGGDLQRLDRISALFESVCGGSCTAGCLQKDTMKSNLPASSFSLRDYLKIGAALGQAGAGTRRETQTAEEELGFFPRKLESENLSPNSLSP